VLPVFQLVLSGSSINMVVRDLPLVVQDLDDSPASRELIDAFRGSLTFRIQPWPTDRRPEAAISAMTRNDQAAGSTCPRTRRRPPRS